MRRFIKTIVLATLLSFAFVPAWAGSDPTTDTKPSDLNLQSSDGTGKLWTLQVWNSGG